VTSAIKLCIRETPHPLPLLKVPDERGVFFSEKMMRTKRPTLRGTKWLGTIPVEAACSVCPEVKFKASFGTHRPNLPECTKSLQQQFEAHLKQAHEEDAGKTAP
jgi:hypothetical protein